MSDLSIEYSLNTPTFFNSNQDILNKKIFDLARNNGVGGGWDGEWEGVGGGKGGGEWNKVGGFGLGLNISDFISLLIGIIIIIIGFVLLRFKNDLIEVQAIIEAQSCDKAQTQNQIQIQSQECDINIRYTVDNTQYSKIISINKNNIPSTQTFSIYYHSSNPNSIQLYNPNYYAIGVGMIIIGIIIMLFFTSSSSSSSTTNEKTDLYSSALNKD